MAHITSAGMPLTLVAAAIAACSSSEESRLAAEKTGSIDTAVTTDLRVSGVMIGRQIGSGNRITEPTFQFAPQDTVYVSVATQGAADGTTLTAAWRSQSGEIIQKTSEPVGPAGENTGFHLAQPKGLKPGTYKVIVFLGSDSVETKVFAVRK